MNSIIIKNLEIFAYHGIHQKEKTNGQNFYIDAICETSQTKGNYTDKLEDTISYSDIIRVIKKALSITSFNLIEAAAENVIHTLFDEFKNLKKIELTLKKPEAPINENFDYVGIKIIRERERKNGASNTFDRK